MNQIPTDFLFPLVKKERITQNVFSLYFEKSAGLTFSFTAGQHVRIVLDGVMGDPKGSSRLFSISSSPHEKHLVITTKLSESPFKKKLFDLPIGALVHFFGPLGELTLIKRNIHHVFLSGGLGITPFYSMLSYLAHKNISPNITLFASYSTEIDIIFFEQIEQIKRENTHFNPVFIITKPVSSNDIINYMGGKLGSELITMHVPDYESATFYIAGSLRFTLFAESVLSGIGISKKRIKKELFTGIR